MNKALAILVVVVVVLTGVPLIMGGAVMCADCGPAVAAASCILAVLLVSGFALALAFHSRLGRRVPVFRPLLLWSTMERPPRLA